jgi:cytochrome c oxidase subunit 2
MKTAPLATALLFALAAALAPQAFAQEARPGDDPATPTVEDAAPAEVLGPGEAAPGAAIDPGTEIGGEPARGEAEAEAVPTSPGAESAIEGTVEPAEPEAVFAMPDLPILGVPVPGGLNYQPAATELAHDTHWLSHWVHGIMTAIVALVLALLAIVIFRYNRAANPTPGRWTHNTRLEIAWTLVPVLILILIGSFSLPILFKQLEIPDPALTVKATGAQWYWSYEYPDNEFGFDSIMLTREELPEHGYADDLYLLATDTALVVPVGAVVKLQVTGSDVIHSWAMPAFGVKMDGVPGRLNETWFQVDEPGVYFGQCSELCGKDHAYMPITVRALAAEDYAAWLDWAIDEYGGTRGDANLALAD